MAEKTKFIGVGKRKRSVARVSLFAPGKGNIEINGINVDKYVPRDSLATIIRQPLSILDKMKEDERLRKNKMQNKSLTEGATPAIDEVLGEKLIIK